MSDATEGLNLGNIYPALTLGALEPGILQRSSEKFSHTYRLSAERAERTHRISIR
jgi:hypothetical protein